MGGDVDPAKMGCEAARRRVAALAAVRARIRRAWLDPAFHPDGRANGRMWLQQHWPELGAAIEQLVAAQDTTALRTDAAAWRKRRWQHKLAEQVLNVGSCLAWIASRR